MIASALVYAGTSLAAAGLAMALLRWLRRTQRLTTPLLGAVVGAGLAIAGITLPARDVVVAQPRDGLDAIIPRYQFHERHALAIDAAPSQVDRAIRSVTADEIRLYRTLTWIRRLGRRGPAGLLDAPSGVPMLALAARTGFHVLTDHPDREIVLGVSLPVSDSAQLAAQAAIREKGKAPFVASTAGYATAVINFRVEAHERGGSVVSTETRVFAPDAATRRAFARYWRMIYPGSALIRRGWLAAIRRRAEGGAAPLRRLPAIASAATVRWMTPINAHRVVIDAVLPNVPRPDR